jgi:hypothetical protein
MAPKHGTDLFPDEPRVLLPGLEYARGILDTAIHICRNLDKRPPDESSPPKGAENKT